MSKEKTHWLTYLGKRRPETLADNRQWGEPGTGPYRKPQPHANPKGVQGHALGRGNRGQ